MSGPELQLQRPDRSLFKFPPDSAPLALAPPPADGSLLGRVPFAIGVDIYNQALSPAVPLTIASTYAVTVTLLNFYNRRHGNKPWRISKTRAFYFFVLAHNIFLAVYSAITNLAMLGALQRTTPAGLFSLLIGFLRTGNFQLGLLQPAVVETVDAYCKIHGPRGLGDAVTFNSTSRAWETRNTALHLGANGAPDLTDVGRLWNEGLAFWGWFFYLSKFYEVMDTAIILAKGKRSSTLQTYHHTGAMLCMWAGMRFMSPPIWMFVYINSGIHALMYTYYTISALGIRVPQGLKRTLTSMQIAQFLIGASFAMVHLFVSYTVPISTPYTIIHHVTSGVESMASEASAAAVAAGSAVAGASWPTFKKILLRAAGEEGLAGNVVDETGKVVGSGSSSPTVEVIEETKWRTEYVKTNCIDTTGQSFAIWLNVIYLVPLTMLFTRFFFHAYSRRSATSKKAVVATTANAVLDAKHSTRAWIEDFGESIERAEWNALPEQLQKDLKRLQFLIKDNTAPQPLVTNAIRDVSRGLAKCQGAANKAGSRALAYLKDKGREIGVSVADSDGEEEVEKFGQNGWAKGNGSGTSNGAGKVNGGVKVKGGVKANGGVKENGNGKANGGGKANGNAKANGGGKENSNGAPSYAEMVKH